MPVLLVQGNVVVGTGSLRRERVLLEEISPLSLHLSDLRDQ